MFRTMLKSKIHRATVTEANLEYEGSISIDKTLLKAADILSYEKVQVVDLSNGARFETYAIEATAGSGTICVNGAAARLVEQGDKIIVMSYINIDEQEALKANPKIILVDEGNKVIHLADSSQFLKEC